MCEVEGQEWEEEDEGGRKVDEWHPLHRRSRSQYGKGETPGFFLPRAAKSPSRGRGRVPGLAKKDDTGRPPHVNGGGWE